MTAARLRKVADGRWPRRRRYEVEVYDDDGRLVSAATTSTPGSELMKHAGAHSTDCWDWVRAADRAFAEGSTQWVTDPFA